MNRLTRDGTAEPVSRDRILRRERGQGNMTFPCSADHEQRWQRYPADPYSARCDDHDYILLYNSSMIMWSCRSNYLWVGGTNSAPDGWRVELVDYDFQKPADVSE